MSYAETIPGLFLGYPADLIARWCLVDLRTARDFKRGRKKPSRRVLHLFDLYRRGKVLVEPAWRDYVVREDGKLYGPSIKYGFNACQLAWLDNELWLASQYIKQREERFGRDKVIDSLRRHRERLDQRAFPPPAPKGRRRSSLN